MKKIDEDILSFLNNQKKLVTTADVAHGIGKPWATVQLHLLTLLSKNYVTHVLIGRTHGWKISEEGRSFLES